MTQPRLDVLRCGVMLEVAEEKSLETGRRQELGGPTGIARRHNSRVGYDQCPPAAQRARGFANRREPSGAEENSCSWLIVE